MNGYIISPIINAPIESGFTPKITDELRCFMAKLSSNIKPVYMRFNINGSLIRTSAEIVEGYVTVNGVVRKTITLYAHIGYIDGTIDINAAFNADGTILSDSVGGSYSADPTGELMPDDGSFPEL